MNEALLEARKAARRGEVPVGAVLVVEEKIVARAHNRVEGDHDPTAHAEMIVIRKAASRNGYARLEDATLYVTVHPCPMCEGALEWARVKRVVWGAPRGQEPPQWTLESKGGILEKKCRRLIQGFFQQHRGS